MDEKTTKVLLIDLENCPSQINQLMNHLDEYSHIVICYAQSGAKIPIDWMMILTKVINEGRLKLIKMPEVGKNAADFGLAFWAGVLMAQLPENTHFDIVSNDTDLDYAVSLLTSQNRSATRCGEQREVKKEIPIAIEYSKASDKPKEASRYLHEYCTHLLMYNNKPKKKDTLLNSIKNKFKTENIDATTVFDELFRNGIIAINGDEIIYRQQKLNIFVDATSVKFSSSPVIESQKIVGVNNLLISHVKEYCEHLVKHKFYPAKKNVLLNSIKTKFKAAGFDVDENKIFESLLTNVVISLNGEEVIYNQQKLNKLAKVN
jgi:hypothetical protein